MKNCPNCGSASIRELAKDKILCSACGKVFIIQEDTIRADMHAEDIIDALHKRITALEEKLKGEKEKNGAKEETRDDERGTW